MDNQKAPDTMVYCPIYGRDIPEGLCWDVANIGDNSLMLPANEKPLCGWDEAYRICKTCPEYDDMGR